MRKFFTLLALLLTGCLLWAQAPSANFTAVQNAGCAPVAISFQDQSLGNPTSWKWDFGNGSTSTLQNPSTTFFTPGTYTITLTVANVNGSNTLSRQGYITIYGKPSIDFTANETIGCSPLEVTFTDASVPSAGTTNVSWQWDFGNGTQSTGQSARARYTQSGTFDVSIKVTNDKGCFANFSKPSTIQITGAIQSAFTYTAVNTCNPPYSVAFTNTTTGPGTLTYFWDFGDGTTSTQKDPSHVYTTPGNYSVTMAVTSSDGCTDTLRKPGLFNIPVVSTTFGAPDSICIRSQVSFDNTSSPTPQSSLWQFGDGTTATEIDPVKSFATPGSYTVQVINNYGFCQDTFAKRITVLPRPVAAFDANNRSQCKPPLKVTFQDASANAVSWLWSFGDGQTSTLKNPEHTYTDYGQFTVTLVVTNLEGCTDTLEQDDFVDIRKPVITFPSLPLAGCIPYTHAFAAAINTVDNVTSYNWNFGDGTTSSAATPSHTYSAQGSYTVSLVINTSTGCTDSLILPNAVTVGRRPVIDFTAVPNPACALQPVAFTGTASEADAWLWNFPNGATSTLQSPVHSFTDTGSFDITLAVTNSGCRVVLTKPAFIKIKPPIARFRVAKDCSLPRNFSFTDESIGAQTWLWNFGDGTTSTAQNPSHTYTAYGVYDVLLTVTNDTCSNTRHLTINVFETKVDFQSGGNNTCKPISIQFNSWAAEPATIQSYSWDFHNGTTSTDINPKVGYAQSGNYDVTMVTTDIYGCNFRVHKDDYIRINGPVANFSVDTTKGCAGMNARFFDQSTTDGRNAITNWRWIFGDGQTDTLTTGGNVQHRYDSAGMFNVGLEVTDAAGCKDIHQVSNYVSVSRPMAAFSTPDTLSCLGSSVRFTNTTSAQNYTSQWSFGDGAVSTDDNPIYTYADTGYFNVGLKIIDVNGCSDTVTYRRYIQVAKTVASFDVSDSIGGCIPYTVNFTNTSKFYRSSAWNFSIGSSTANNPVATYRQAGVFPVTLQVTGPGGCTDVATKTIRIFHDSLISYSYTPFDGCKPFLLRTTINSPAPMDYTWDFGDGTLVTTKNNDTAHTYMTFGNYLPKLIISDSGNCLLPFIGTDTIRVKGVITKFGLDQRLFCDSGTIQVLDSTTTNDGPLSYNWNFGDGNTSSLTNPTHSYQQPGNYTVTLTAQSASRCADTTTFVNAVKVVQSPLISIAGDLEVCKDELLSHAGLHLRQDTEATEWFWQFPNGNTATGMRPATQRYRDTGDFLVTAIAINSSGCADTAMRAMTVLPLPVITLPPTITTLVGTPVELQPTYSSNVVGYAWSPTTWLSCADCPRPVATPKFSTTYTVVATDNNGCSNLAQVNIIVLCRNANIFVPNTFSPNGDGSNDVFYVRGSGLARVKTMRIFNRLGEVVFERQNFMANDPTMGWDGTYKNTRLSPDTYIYQVDVFCENNEILRLDGSIALIR